MRESFAFWHAVVAALVLFCGEASMGAEAKRIEVRPGGDGSGVRITAPAGFGKWFLHFPETMLLEGPGRGKAKMSETVRDDGTIVLEGRMAGEFAHAIRITYKPGKEAIDLTLEVTNLSKNKWPFGGEAMACLRPLESPDLVGEVGTRTLIFHGGKLQSVASIGEQLKRRIGPGTTVSCPVRGEEMAPYQAERHDKRWSVDDGVILRRSRDGARLVAFAWDRVHRVSMNFTHSCLHSNPRVTALAPGASCRRTGRIYFLTSSVEDLWKRYREDFKKSAD